MSDWHLYMLRCNDDSLYTGITKNVERRVAQHRRGEGARYLRGRTPLTLVFTSFVLDHGDALRMERNIKSLAKSQKERLAHGDEQLFTALFDAMHLRQKTKENAHDPSEGSPQ